MAFSANPSVQGDVATIALSGELDASAAPSFRDAIEKVSGQNLTRLVLMMQELEYMASAGLRVLIFAKQKMGSHVDIYVVAPQEQVKDTLEKTGYDKGVIMTDSYSG